MHVLLVVVIAVVVIAVGTYLSVRRSKELAAWAALNGLTMSTGSDRGFDDRFPDLDCLRRGHSRYASNVMTGKWSEPGDEEEPLSVCAFDYHYKTGSGKDETTHSFSGVIAYSPVPLEPLFIRPEGFFDKVTEFFGADDIDFESAEFSRQFFVKSPDKRWAYDVIHQRMMNFLLSVPRFHVQFTNYHIAAWRSNCFGAADFGSAIRLIRGMLKRLPDYLVKQQTERGRT